ncbi:MAG: YvrJ family protein [Bacillota bacterium]
MSNDVSIWITFLRDIGFPIAITTYLLLRFEKKIDKLADALEELKNNESN